MRYALLVAVFATFGCGKEIGDPCIISSDCSPNNDRVCDISAKEGYCTITGCDVGTCPSEAACIRFFSGGFTNLPCADASECSLDELCSLAGLCVPRSSERRLCMRTCDTDGDCRSGYECRDIAKMMAHGGEPVLAPGEPVTASSPKFCAAAPP
jgi:hypothetical protein